MRRSDREIKDMDQIMEIVSQAAVCCVAFHDEPCPYIIPINYGAAREDGSTVLYFHGAAAGKKLELLDRNPNVAFTIVGDWKVRLNSEDVGKTTTSFESVCGHGRAEVVPESERGRGLAVLMNQAGKSEGKTYSESDITGACAGRTAVWKITVDGLTGKLHE